MMLLLLLLLLLLRHPAAHESGVVVTHADPEVLVLALVDLEDLFDDLFKLDRPGGGRDLEGGCLGVLLLRAAPEYLAFAGCIVAPCLFGRHLATKRSVVKGYVRGCVQMP